MKSRDQKIKYEKWQAFHQKLFFIGVCALLSTFILLFIGCIFYSQDMCRADQVWSQQISDTVFKDPAFIIPALILLGIGTGFVCMALGLVGGWDN